MNVIPVIVPPLRERNGDIIILAEHFIKKYSEVNEKKEPVLTAEAKASLMAYPWPGNVRELENVIERAVLICQSDQIMPSNLFLEKDRGTPERPSIPREHEERLSQNIGDEKNNTLYEMEKSMIFDTLNKVNWNKTKASKILGISVRTMRNKLNEYGIKDVNPDD